MLLVSDVVLELDLCRFDVLLIFSRLSMSFLTLLDSDVMISSGLGLSNVTSNFLLILGESKFTLIIMYVTCTITELEHHDHNIIEKNRYIKSMRKAVFRIMGENNLLNYRYNYRSPARRVVESIVSVQKPNDVWEMDIKYCTYMERIERHTCLPSSTVTPGRLWENISDITALPRR